jgi:predicted AAA+ superfamily ATPase
MKLRSFWLHKIAQAWQKRPIIWLSGVRRAGKTLLAKSLEDIEYFDCESPSTRFLFEDTERVLKKLKGKRIVIDEIHRLPEPTELLKLAHDYYPDTRILATGSSTLGVSGHFKDTLTGRKTELWLTPMNNTDLKDFGIPDLERRLLFGGLPPFFLADQLPEEDFREWMESYWSRDVQELFRLEKRSAFLKLAEMLFASSGTLFEATRFTASCEANRQTIINYLSVLEHTYIVHIIRPFHSRKTTEIISTPKVYAFDTGFVCYFKGINQLRPEDRGLLWEHMVLNELHSFVHSKQIAFWRDKREHEIDFVVTRRGKSPDAIECKWRAKEIDTRNLQAFRRAYPDGRNFVVCSDVETPFTRHDKGLDLNYVGLQHLGQVAF